MMKKKQSKKEKKERKERKGKKRKKKKTRGKRSTAPKILSTEVVMDVLEGNPSIPLSSAQLPSITHLSQLLSQFL